MFANVQIIEGGKLIRAEKMKLKKVKDFDRNISVYENEDGAAVIYFKEKDEYVLVSIDMA